MVSRRARVGVLSASLILSAGIALEGCASDGSGGAGSAAGAPANAGASGTATAGASSAGGASGSVGVSGSSGAGGIATQAGSANGGSLNGGSANGGAAGAVTAGAAGAAGASAGAAGSANCAGNAISLSANGTGTASDAARARIDLDLKGDLPIGNARRTVEFWAYIKSTDWLGEKNEVFVYGSPGTTNTAFGLDFGTNTVTGMPGNHATLNPYTNGSFTIDSQADLGVSSSSDQWLHVAMSWDGAAFKTYINGDLKITKTDAGAMLATTSSLLTMGCNPPINNCFNGYFDELRVWNIDRSASDIKASYAKQLVGNEPGLVGYFRFDEAPAATSAADSVTSAGHTAHTGQLMAAAPAMLPTFITPSPPAPILCP